MRAWREAAVPAASLRAHAWRLLPQAGLVCLLVVELLVLSIRFDTRTLDQIPSFWARLLGWAPEYLRLAITTPVFALLISGTAILSGLLAAEPGAVRLRPSLLALHLGGLAVFAWITARVMGQAFVTAPHQGAWVLAWLAAGAATLGAWGLSAFPGATWLAILRRGRVGVLWGLGAGAAAWTGGFYTQELWRPLVGYTFRVVTWTIGWIYANPISDPATFEVGTPTFSVEIAPECSGYEGIGLILAFLGIYLWLFRREFRFPAALLLLPLGAAAVWILNVARLAALIVIGTAGWPDLALGGFHSQAGWLAFNAVGLGFVAITTRGRYFMTTPARGETNTAVTANNTAEATTAYLAPLLAIVATTMVTGAVSAGFDWLYPMRVVAAGAVLWTFRHRYTEMRWRWSWSAIAIGAAVFVLWLLLMPAAARANDDWPTALAAIPAGWAALWLAVRVLGYVVTVPLAEELVFRGFLPRRFLRADFQSLPVAASWLPVVISSVLFGVLHGQFWVAGTIAGLLFAVALWRGEALGDAVQAHATANGLMVIYVFATGHWSAWS